MNTSRIRLARLEDLKGLLGLAKEVEHLFGPMTEVPEFHQGMTMAIENDQVFTALHSSLDRPDHVAGGLVVSPVTNSIAWLVVARAARGKGLGRKLLARAVTCLDAARPVTVQTFAPSCHEGLAARRLYLQSGFEDRAPQGSNPAGIPTVLMVQPPRRNLG